MATSTRNADGQSALPRRRYGGPMSGAPAVIARRSRSICRSLSAKYSASKFPERMTFGGAGHGDIESARGAIRSESSGAIAFASAVESVKKNASSVSVRATRYRTPGTGRKATRALSFVALIESPALTTRSTSPHGCHVPVRGQFGSPGAGGRTGCGAPVVTVPCGAGLSRPQASRATVIAVQPMNV